MQRPIIAEVAIGLHAFAAKDRKDAARDGAGLRPRRVRGPRCPLTGVQRLCGRADEILRLGFVLQPSQFGEQLVRPDRLIRDNKDARGSDGQRRRFRLRNTRRGRPGGRQAARVGGTGG